MSDEPCDHYGSQVAVRMGEVEVTDPEQVDRYCDWCGGLPNLVLVKSERDKLVFCEECRGVIRTLAGGRDE